jgi:Methyltransferase domain
MSGNPCCSHVRPENAARMFTNPAPVLSHRRVKECLDNEPLRIIELGGGCLRNALFLQQEHHHVTVVEVPGMERRFPKQYQVFRQRGGIVRDSIPNSSRFDLAVATFVIETICNPRDRVIMLRQLSAQLGRRSVLVISVRGPRDLITARAKGRRCSDGYLTPNLTFARAYTRKQLQNLLVKCGFAKVEFLHKSWSREPELLHAIARTTEF